MSEQKIINNTIEFIDFIDSDENRQSSFESNFSAIRSNMNGMRASLSRRPCSCGGVNPDAVIEQRRKNLEDFYASWLSQLEGENLKKFKEIMPTNLILKSEYNIIIEL